MPGEDIETYRFLSKLIELIGNGKASGEIAVLTPSKIGGLA